MLTVMRLCSGSPNSTCFLWSSLLRCQLCEKAPTILRHSPRARSFFCLWSCNAFVTAKFRLWPKQLSHCQFRDLIAAEMLVALSVVMAESFLSSSCQSWSACLSAAARLSAVWLSGKYVVWRHLDSSFHSDVGLMVWTVKRHIWCHVNWPPHVSC